MSHSCGEPLPCRHSCFRTRHAQYCVHKQQDFSYDPGPSLVASSQLQQLQLPL